MSRPDVSETATSAKRAGRTTYEEVADLREVGVGGESRDADGTDD